MALSASIFTVGVNCAIGQTVFDLVFEGATAHPPGYLKKTHIWLWLNGELVADSDAGGVGANGFDWITDTQVELKTVDLVAGDVLEFRRTIPKDEIYVNFADRSGITEAMLDNASLANMYSIHEIMDGYGTGVYDYYSLAQAYAEAAAESATAAAASAALAGASSAGTLGSYGFVGDGSTVAFGSGALNATLKQNVKIFVDGIYQDPDTWSYAAGTVTFSEAPPEPGVTGAKNIWILIAEAAGTDYSNTVGVLVDDLSSITGSDGDYRKCVGKSSYMDGGEGIFIWNNSNLSTEVTADTQQGVYVAPTSDVTGASGAWVRGGWAKVNRLWFSTLQGWIDFCVNNDLEGDSKDFLRSDVVLTVGSGENFETINAALRFLSPMAKAYEEYDGWEDEVQYITLELQTGFVMEEQVRVDGGLNLGWIAITSVDTEVTIDRQYLTQKIGGRYPAFGAENNSTLPTIACLFNMNSTGTATYRDGVYLFNGSKALIIEYPVTSPGTPITGIKNAGARGLHCATGSIALAENTIWSGAGDIGARVSNGSVAQLRDSDLSGALGTACLAVAGASQVNALGVDCSGATNAGAAITGASQVQITDGDFSDAGTDGIQVGGSSVVQADGVDVSGAGTDGIIASDGAVINANGATLSTNASPAGRYGAFAESGAIIQCEGCTCIDPTTRGLYALHGGMIFATGSTLTGAGNTNADATYSGKIDCSLSTITGGGSYEIVAAFGGEVGARSADISGGTAYAFGGARLDLDGATATGSTIRNDDGAIINGNNVTGSPTFTRTINTLTANGIVFG